MLATLGLLAGLAGPAAPAVALRRPTPQPLYRAIADARPRISVWTNTTSPYDRGDRARVYLSAETDAYVTVLRVDTDGRVRVLYPLEPWQDNFVRGGRTFEVLGRDDDNAFDVDDYPGVGYIFAVASDDPFTYDGYVRGDHWDYRTIADGRVTGDPYVALTDFASRIVGQGDWDYDITPYYVQKHYDYPRFVCYDCHAYASYTYWDPYARFCPRFRIEMYNDPYYYPYYYGGRRTVVVRPYRPQPRFVFKDYNGSIPTGGYVTVLDHRPIRPNGGGPTVVPDRGRTGADLGGRGTIPAPTDRGRRPVRPDVGGAPQGQGQPAQPRQPGEPGRRPGQPEQRPQRPPVQPDIGGIGPMRRPADDGRGQPQAQPGTGGGQPPADAGRRIEPNRPPADQLREPRPAEEPRRMEPDRPPAYQPPSRPQPEPRPPQAEPRREPPRNVAPPPRYQPRPQPQSQPRSGGGGGGQPELRRRRP
jgi:hypothetical protein